MHSYLKRSSITILLAITGVISTAVSAAEYYKWTDKDGVLHFSERPPQTADAKAVKVKVHIRTPSPSDTGAPNEHAPLKQATAAPAAPKDSVDLARCAAEKKRLQTLNSGTRIRMKDGQGGFYYLEREQIDAEMRKSRQAIKESCE